MARWLFKQEPDAYSFAQLTVDGSTIWDGVSNALALKYLRQVVKGDRIFFYHTGKEKAVVGEMRALAAATEDENGVTVKVQAVRALTRPVTLATIKADPLLAEWDLVRLPRLSVMPVTDEQWQRVEELSAES